MKIIKQKVLSFIIDFDFIPSIVHISNSYFKYLKRVKNRQKLYKKLKKKGRRL